jgi:hypothetical protein
MRAALIKAFGESTEMFELADVPVRIAGKHMYLWMSGSRETRVAPGSIGVRSRLPAGGGQTSRAPQGFVTAIYRACIESQNAPRVIPLRRHLATVR